MRSPRRTCPPALPGASGRRKPVVRVLPPDFLKTELRVLACTFAELGTFFFQLRVTMFPSGWRLPLPGESGLVSSPRTSCYSQQPTGFPITDELTGVARGCGIKDGRRRKPTANFLKTPRCQGSEHPPRVTHAPPPDTLTHTHTHFTQNHSTGEQRVFTQC